MIPRTVKREYVKMTKDMLERWKGMGCAIPRFSQIMGQGHKQRKSVSTDLVLENGRPWER